LYENYVKTKLLVPIPNIYLYFRLVSGAGEIKITKDGNVLLHEMVTKDLKMTVT
jgi:hypothetical protein